MDLRSQYELVKSSRRVLLDYCATLSHSDFLIENSSFGRGSIRNLLVHIGNTYELWIGKYSLRQDNEFTAYDAIKNAAEASDFFSSIDVVLNDFFHTYSDKFTEDIEIIVNDSTTRASPMKLFMHVITHEFHHKGQILSLSRHLGYVPVDTDIIR